MFSCPTCTKTFEYNIFIFLCNITISRWNIIFSDKCICKKWKHVEITIKLRWGMGKRRYKNWLQKFSWTIKFSSNSTMMGCSYLHTSVRPPEMRGKKSKLRCLWMVPQAVEVKGRIKNRKRWRYLTEQAHTHTHQYWLNWCLPHESHQFYYVTSRSRGSFWHSVQSSSMSKDIFCRTCEHDLFCSLPPSFSLAESMTTEKKKYHSLNQKACS